MMDFPFPMIALKIQEDEIELRAWLKHCRSKGVFENRNSLEVCNLAIEFGGFDRDVVYRVLSDFRSAIEGSSPDSFSSLMVWSFEETVSRVMKMRDDLEKAKKDLECVNLMPYWKELVANQITGGTSNG